MSQWIKALGLCVGTLLVFATQVEAQTATTTFTVTASVTANCTISTVGITFGAYDPVVANAETPVDANGSVTVACTNGATTTIGMNQGSNPTGTSTAATPERQMSSGTDNLRYDLFQEAARTTIWGDVGTPTTVAYTSTGTAETTIDIFGRIPAGQDSSVGTYTDTVTATISF